MNNTNLDYKQKFVTLEEAAKFIGKTPDNIRDYIQRGRIAKYNPEGNQILYAKNGELRISIKEIELFMNTLNKDISKHISSDLNHELGFYNTPERDRTKHVHRLHPYLGKFIPQLVEWFLKRYFHEDSIILDPFMGSGTTLVQGNEMKMHTIGIEVSEFNCLIARVKTSKYNLDEAKKEILDAEKLVTDFSKLINQSKHNILLFDKYTHNLIKNCNSEYLKNWFAPRTLYEMLYYKELIELYKYQDLLRIVLSRAVRSSRLVPHFDLATPKEPLPVGKEYWCRKHNRLCKPIEECLVKIHAYSQDTARRIDQYDGLRSNKEIKIIQGDSRFIDMRKELNSTSLFDKSIDGIFTSPPYVGQIDYHDQHTYAYELFGFARNDGLEIGPKTKGKSKQSQEQYVKDISAVFINLLPYLKEDAKIFIVANDRFDLYPKIADISGMSIVEVVKRAVTKRTEQGDDPYQESIFLLKKRR